MPGFRTDNSRGNMPIPSVLVVLLNLVLMLMVLRQLQSKLYHARANLEMEQRKVSGVE